MLATASTWSGRTLGANLGKEGWVVGALTLLSSSSLVASNDVHSPLLAGVCV